MTKLMSSNDKKYLFFVLFCFLVGGFFSCKKSEKKLLARVGSVKIYEEDYLKELLGMPQIYQNYLSTLEGKKQLLDIMLRERILLAKAEQSGIAKKKEIQKSLKDFKEKQKEEATEFRKGLFLRDYLRDLQDGELKVTEAEIKVYYQDHKDEFLNPKKISASHILTSSEVEAEAALARIKKGEDFAKVARETSKDPSAIRGGAIGEVSRGELSDLPEFEKALWPLRNGQISSIVKTRLGYHIIKKTGEIRLPNQSYEKVVPQIRRILEKRKFDLWVEKIKSEKKVWVDEQLLASFKLSSPEEPDSKNVPSPAEK